MNALDTARELGAEHGVRAATAWLSRTGVESSDERLPEPDLDGLQVSQALGIFVAEGDVDTRYDLRQSYDVAYRAAVETTIRAACQ